MTTPESVDVREVLARLLAEEYYDDDEWPKLPDRKREYYRSKADWILATVTPVIRRQVASEIEDYLRTVGYWQFGGTRHVRDALAIARSHSTQPTEEETTGE